MFPNRQCSPPTFIEIWETGEIGQFNRGNRAVQQGKRQFNRRNRAVQQGKQGK